MIARKRTLCPNSAIYNGLNLIAEYDGSGNLAVSYLHGPGIDSPISMTRNGQTYYYGADALRSVRELTDSTGAIGQTYRYDVFGAIIQRSGAIENPFMYTGREYDAETGLYYYRARYYDPFAGRFISRDPTGYPDGPNARIYATNNPAVFSDPFGLEITDNIRDKVGECNTSNGPEASRAKTRFHSIKDFLKGTTGLPAYGRAIAATTCRRRYIIGPTDAIMNTVAAWNDEDVCGCIEHCAHVHELVHANMCVDMGAGNFGDLTPREREGPAYEAECKCLGATYGWGSGGCKFIP